MKDLLIRGHLGLGDHILCNGLVRHFAKFEPNRIIHVPCKAHNFESVQWMFSDVDNVNVRAFAGDLEVDQAAQDLEDAGIAEVLRLSPSWPDGSKPPKGFDEAFYLSAGVPFEQRWEGFHVERAHKQHHVPFGRFCFIHDDPLRGFKIADPKGPNIIRATYDPDTPNLFQWQAILEMAEAIHCIPSSFSVLVDSIETHPEQKLYLHGYARPGWDKHTYKKDWTIL